MRVKSAQEKAARGKAAREKAARQKAEREKALQAGSTQGEQTVQAEQERTAQEGARQDRGAEEQVAQAEHDSEDQQPIDDFLSGLTTFANAFTPPKRVPGYIEASVASSKAKHDAAERLIKDDAIATRLPVLRQDPITQEQVEQI